MDVRLKFLGGAQTVTGSRYVLEFNGHRILVDCGMFQGLKEHRLRNWEDFPVDPKEINAVLLTHAHIDHSGYLPRLVKSGFKGTIHCTDATADLLEIMLMDSAKLQEEEAEYAKKKGYSKHSNPQPLYFSSDVSQTMHLIQSHTYEEAFQLFDRVEVKFRDAGHILGSAMVEITVSGLEQKKTLLFSGDIGKEDQVILPPPVEVKQADVLLVESTYGDEDNPGLDVINSFRDLVLQAMERGGCLLIPAFSVGRTQNLIYYLSKLFDEGALPPIPVYIDSPMALNVTNLYKKYKNYHRIDDQFLEGADCIFENPNLHYIRDQKRSNLLNLIKGNAIIISASGMCTGGRILHHLFHRLPRKNDTLLFVGFQPEGTRGRDILDGKENIRIFGESVDVRCDVKVLNGLSAHAYRDELISWMGKFEDAPKMTFLVHGEPKVQEQFAQSIKEQLGWETIIPMYQESFELFSGI